jgi:hypothetical protein
VYEEAEANQLKQEKGWVFKQDGNKWRRVVPSPLPKRIFEIRPVRWLLEKGTIVICAGGGGIPTMYDPSKERWLTGIEAVIDKDLASELLAREVEADLFVIATDVDGVYLDWGKPSQRKLLGYACKCALSFRPVHGRKVMPHPVWEKRKRAIGSLKISRNRCRSGRHQCNWINQINKDKSKPNRKEGQSWVKFRS